MLLGAMPSIQLLSSWGGRGSKVSLEPSGSLLPLAQNNLRPQSPILG